VDVVAVVTRDGLAAVGIRAAQIVGRERVLTAERQRADTVLGQADVGLAAEQVATLTQRACARVKAVFQRENGLQTATEVFRTAEAPTAALSDAVAVLDEVLRLGIGVVHIRDT